MDSHRRKNAIVVGMARSGTSLTASVFARQGYFVADDPARDLAAPGASNPKGYWEPRQVIDANVSLLSGVGFPCHNTWTSAPIGAEQAQAIPALPQRDEHRRLLEHYERYRPWVWKDCRFCYTLGYWWPMMDPETTGVLLVTRDPQEVWRSFLRAGWGDEHVRGKRDVVRRTREHIAAARATIRRLGIPHIEVDYRDYRTEPDETARRIGDFFDLPLSGQEIGYESRYDSSAGRGYLSYLAERSKRILPQSTKKLLKRLLPESMLRFIRPGRS